MTPQLRERSAIGTATLTSLLRDAAPAQVMLCTPSRLLEQERLGDPLLSDVSVSWSAPGSLLDQTRRIAETAQRVAALHGADHALVITDGSTGANQTALGAYGRLVRSGLFLIDRQCHHSVPFDLTRQGLDWGYIPGAGWEADWETPLPVTAAAVADALGRAPKPVGCVVVTSPTYAGQCADLPSIVRTVRHLAPGAFIHVDQAWGSHMPWISEFQPLSAMAAGADTASISIHKQAGCLQPGAALLALTERVPREVLHASYADRASTSQSLLIAQSIDASQRYLAMNGDDCFGRVIDAARELKELLRSKVDGLLFFDETSRGPHDPTKLTLSLDAFATTGYELAAALEKQGIVAEKASPRTITFLATLATHHEDVARAAVATASALADAGSRDEPPVALSNPYCVGDAMPTLSPTYVVRQALHSGLVVPAEQTIGKVAAERIEAYPPGIAVVFEGFRIRRESLVWLDAVRRAGGTIRAQDETLATIRILPEGVL